MIRTFKVGGMTFLQVGQFSMSYCFTKKRAPLLNADMGYAAALAALVGANVFVWTADGFAAIHGVVAMLYDFGIIG